MPASSDARLPSDLPVGRVRSALRRLGFEVAREGGRHTIFIDPTNRSRLVAVPRHSRVKRQLLLGELRRVGISEEQFVAVY